MANGFFVVTDLLAGVPWVGLVSTHKVCLASTVLVEMSLPHVAGLALDVEKYRFHLLGV